jgi:hypothetical protein
MEGLGGEARGSGRGGWARGRAVGSGRVGLELGWGTPLRTVAVHPSPKQPTIVISLEHGLG